MRNYNDIFLALERKLHILVRNWYDLARYYTYWREFVVFGLTRLALTRNIVNFFLAGIGLVKEIEKPPGLSYLSAANQTQTQQI